MRSMNEKEEEQKGMKCRIMIEEEKKGRKRKENEKGTEKRDEKNVEFASFAFKYEM